MTVITTVEDLRVLARHHVPRMICDHADSGSWTGSTYRANTDLRKVDRGILLPGTYRASGGVMSLPLRAMAGVFVAGCLSFSGQPSLAADPPMLGYSVANMDRRVSPREDFYRYAAGRWLERTEIPASEGDIGGFGLLKDNLDAQLQQLILQAAASQAAPGSPKQQVGDYWRAAMDVKRLDEAGLHPLKADLARVDAIGQTVPSAGTLAELSALMQLRYGASPLLNAGVMPDAKDSASGLLVLVPGFQSLTQDEYAKPEGQRIRDLYVAHITRMFQSAGDSAEAAAVAARTVLDVETALSAARLTQLQTRDPSRTYNKMTPAEAQALVPLIDLGTLLTGLGLGPQAAVQVFDLDGTRAVQRVVGALPPADLRALLRWHLLNAGASLLGQPWRGLDEAFTRDRRGLATSPPREREVTRTISTRLFHPLSQLYVEAHFPPTRRQEIVRMVDRIKSEFDRRLRSNPWLDAPTRAAALAKLARVDVQVGYPATWIDFSSVSIRPDDHFGNNQRIAEFLLRRELGRAGKPVVVERFAEPDKTTPIAVNAGYNPTTNSIDITAAIVQPPFYTPGADAAVNYCTMGAVIGHELTHGFDSFGRQFGPAGNLRDWWTPQATTEFQKRTDVLVQQYGNFQILPGLMHNGAQTIGENTADLGGITLAYHALQRDLKGQPQRRIDGLNSDQRCFVAWAQLWSYKARPERLRLLVATDFHSISSLRGYAPLLHLDAFHRAFGTRPGDRMWRAPNQRVQIW